MGKKNNKKLAQKPTDKIHTEKKKVEKKSRETKRKEQILKKFKINYLIKFGSYVRIEFLVAFFITYVMHTYLNLNTIPIYKATFFKTTPLAMLIEIIYENLNKVPSSQYIPNSYSVLTVSVMYYSIYILISYCGEHNIFSFLSLFMIMLDSSLYNHLLGHPSLCITILSIVISYIFMYKYFQNDVPPKKIFYVLLSIIFIAISCSIHHECFIVSFSLILFLIIKGIQDVSYFSNHEKNFDVDSKDKNVNENEMVVLTILQCGLVPIFFLLIYAISNFIGMPSSVSHLLSVNDYKDELKFIQWNTPNFLFSFLSFLFIWNMKSGKLFSLSLFVSAINLIIFPVLSGANSTFIRLILSRILLTCLSGCCLSNQSSNFYACLIMTIEIIFIWRFIFNFSPRTEFSHI